MLHERGPFKYYILKIFKKDFDLFFTLSLAERGKDILIKNYGFA